MKLVYLNTKSVKNLIKQQGKQSTPEFLIALDKKLEQQILEITKKFNGHHKRLTAMEVNL
jgi:hypothetical protein